jgi:hypothetical protein
MGSLAITSLSPLILLALHHITFLQIALLSDRRPGFRRRICAALELLPVLLRGRLHEASDQSTTGTCYPAS